MSHSVVSHSLRPHGLYSPQNSPGQNTGAVSFSLLQGITPTQGSNPGLLHCRQILYQLRHKGSLRILEWVAYSFSIGSSQPRNRTGVSCIAGGFFTNWAIREAQNLFYKCQFFRNRILFLNMVVASWLKYNNFIHQGLKSIFPNFSLGFLTFSLLKKKKNGSVHTFRNFLCWCVFSSLEK